MNISEFLERVLTVSSQHHFHKSMVAPEKKLDWCVGSSGRRQFVMLSQTSLQGGVWTMLQTSGPLLCFCPVSPSSLTGILGLLISFPLSVAVDGRGTIRIMVLGIISLFEYQGSGSSSLTGSTLIVFGISCLPPPCFLCQFPRFPSDLLLSPQVGQSGPASGDWTLLALSDLPSSRNGA